jgi:hypothetical protein
MTPYIICAPFFPLFLNYLTGNDFVSKIILNKIFKELMVFEPMLWQHLLFKFKRIIFRTKSKLVEIIKAIVERMKHIY